MEIVRGTITVGDTGTVWTDSQLTPTEQQDAEAWLARRHLLGTGYSAVISWQRSNRVLGCICPKPSCRRLATRVSTVVEAHPGPAHGGLGTISTRRAWSCSCGRSWTVHRGPASDRLEVMT
jgi:hypothetical protein